MASMSYIDGDSVTHDLSDPDGLMYLLGFDGFGMPEINIFEDRAPAVHGSVYRDFLFQPRTLRVPLMVNADTESAFDTLRETLLGYFSPFKGLGRLHYEKDDGAIREIYCLYKDGLGYDNRGKMDAALPVVVALHAPDPFWFDPTEVSVEYNVTGTYSLYSPLYSPLYTAGSVTTFEFVHNYPGSAPAWPQFDIAGPFDDPVFENKTLDKTLSLDTSLVAGETLRVITKPGSKAINKISGGVTTSLLSTRLAGSEFWYLKPGNNTISLGVANATGASIEMSYYKNYLGV